MAWRRVRVSNLPDPDLMTPAERRAEVATLLATGFLRHQLREATKREKSLDVLRLASDECLEPTSTGERHE